MHNTLRIFVLYPALCFSTCFYQSVYAATPAANDPEFDEILSQDISDLNVTSVAKRSQRLTDTAAAVYVITQEDIRRAGVYSIPDVLRMVPGMQVAKLSADRWAVSSRGFNSTSNNKMLVLIDGRAIYTPVFSGVYWGDQSTSIYDIDRIEVIRGPGASLYGANAVNGVVNIITKSAENTQGNLVSATTSSKGNGIYEARHGGRINDNQFYRAYAQYYDGEVWNRTRSGFRLDGKTSNQDTYTLQGDAFGGEQNISQRANFSTAPFSRTIRSEDSAYGATLLGRWDHKIDARSEVSLQTYVDHYTREELLADQQVTTADMQLQHSAALDDRNNFVWGGGARLSYLDLSSTFGASFNDQYDSHYILNAFAQDEYAVVPDKLYLTVGSKFEYNDFTGFEVQPTTRLAWHPTSNQTVWGAVSRAVRTPSSIEEDVSLVALVTPGAPPTESRVLGNPNQKSEELIAYELGHRIQPLNNLSFDTALFYNDFDNLQTFSTPGATFVNPSTGNNVLPYLFNNLGEGHVYGVEFATNWNVTPDWRLSGSYTYMKMNLSTKPGAAVTLDATEELVPQNQFTVQSFYNISDTLHWDNSLYFVDALSGGVGSYFRYDTRVAWLVQPGLEVSLIGRNLIDPHPEFPSTPLVELDRSFIGQILWKF